MERIRRDRRALYRGALLKEAKQISAPTWWNSLPKICCSNHPFLQHEVITHTHTQTHMSASTKPQAWWRETLNHRWGGDAQPLLNPLPVSPWSRFCMSKKLMPVQFDLVPLNPGLGDPVWVSRPHKTRWTASEEDTLTVLYVCLYMIIQSIVSVQHPAAKERETFICVICVPIAWNRVVRNMVQLISRF